jgi:multicomponent Na+:H+ antiporter subunit E
MLKKTLHHCAVLGVLFFTWCLLSGIFTQLLLGTGLFSCIVVTFLTRRMEIIDRESHPFHLVYLGPFYWLWLAKEMLISGIKVTRAIWKFEQHLNPGFAWVRTHLQSDLGLAIYANSLTLTPGTVCVDLEKTRVYIHALDKTSLDEMELGRIEERVARISTFAQTETEN